MGRGNVGGLGIQQALVVGAETQLDQRPRIRSDPGLPAVVSLIPGEGILRLLVPNAARSAAHVVLADKGALDGLGAFGVDTALCVRPRRALGAVFAGMCPGA